MNNDKRVKMVMPCDVAVRRYYRMYVTVDEGAGKKEIEAAVHDELFAANDQDAILTLDPDLDIEDQDICWIKPDEEGCWQDGASESGEDRAPESRRANAMRRVARSAMNMLRLARPDRKLVIGYAKPDDKMIQRYTDWQRRRHGLRVGDEYFLVWDCAPDWDTDKPDLLYAVDVSADSLLTAAWELFELLSKKF